MSHELQKAKQELEAANARCAELSSECARLKHRNQVTVCTCTYVMIMFGHLLVLNVLVSHLSTLQRHCHMVVSGGIYMYM